MSTWDINRREECGIGIDSDSREKCRCGKNYTYHKSTVFFFNVM